MQINYEKITEALQAIAYDAGSLIMEIYNSDDFEVKSKEDQSPVTIADERADELISSRLKSAFPEIPVMSEEQAHSHENTHQVFLIVDPLDGTKEFIKRRGEFTVNIALVENGRPTRGVVYAPAKERMFITDKEGASFEINSEGKTRIEVSKPNNRGLRVVASKSHRDQATDDYISKYEVADLVSAGSSLKFCLVASGEADLYPRLGRTMEWDTAAGHAVLLGAGGKVVRLDSFEELHYGKEGNDNPFFLAYAPGVDLKKAL